MTKTRIHTCPVCGKPADEEHRPFCSARCRQVDLSRWLKEVYVVPGDETLPPAGSGEDDDD
ncbi:DNA gyrase inhibitor YacG [Telmatospirillum sp.]|uniref:DNA gyrase inhibitor YacG n=1 Tax=Telmatospirillum sp. TaxID=2079197 RepID=UPI0028419164|nr:DNA gyrase inhibitor YacG [Telmatospirillum sp.]MDR3439903.1 DNA gyrase inhibitor YacG [Telmatospirillum sp.]